MSKLVMQQTRFHNPEIRNHFIQMWNSGVTRLRIAEAIPLCNEHAVYKWVKKLNLPLRGKGWLRGKTRPIR